MPFMPMWRKNANQIIPTGGIDTIRIPDTGEYATIRREGGDFTIASSASGAATLTLNSGSDAEIRMGAGGDINAFKIARSGSDDKIGFFGSTPIAQVTKPAVPGADPAQLETAVGAILTALENYGLLTS